MPAALQRAKEGGGFGFCSIAEMRPGHSTPARSTGSWQHQQQDPQITAPPIDRRAQGLARRKALRALEVNRPLNALGPVPGVDVMTKRPQGLLNAGGSFRADGGAAFLRS
jgi:hypothetical protein